MTVHGSIAQAGQTENRRGLQHPGRRARFDALQPDTNLQHQPSPPSALGRAPLSPIPMAALHLVGFFPAHSGPFGSGLYASLRGIAVHWIQRVA